ncbi:MAG: inositol monophosphatase [Candidatus Diapherotrites archaeon]
MTEYKAFALDLAEKAGKIIRENFSVGMKKEWKSDHSPVTETDLKINQMVIEAVQKQFPEHGILSEEESAFDGKSEYVWVCDPVDGTIAFSHAVPTCVFSLALVRNGESILGVVADPFLERMFSAEKGKGAFLNGKKLHVSEQTSLSNAVIGCGRWKGKTYDLEALTFPLLEEGASVLDLGSVTYMGMLVSSGEFAGNLFQGIRPWDMAALKVIVEEAGGKMTDLFGNEQRYDRDLRGAIASNGKVHDELVKMVQKYMKGPK